MKNIIMRKKSEFDIIDGVTVQYNDFVTIIGDENGAKMWFVCLPTHTYLNMYKLAQANTRVEDNFDSAVEICKAAGYKEG